MADRYGPRPPSDPTPIPMHERIRNRREELGLAAHELAKRAGVSPSYISLIESGAKIPSEEVARRIAQALDDNPRVYAAWSHTSRYGEPDRYLEDARDLAALTTDPKARRRLASGEDLDLFRDLDAGERRAPRTYGDPRASRVARARAAKLREVDPRIETMDLFHDPDAGERGAVLETAASDAAPSPTSRFVEIPVLRDGADPGEDPDSSNQVQDRFVLDSRLVPEQPDGKLFAYRPSWPRSTETTPPFLRRVRGLIRPRALLVLTTRLRQPNPRRVQAIRTEDGIVLARALFKKNALLLLPPEHSDHIEVIDLQGRGQLAEIVAGTVVTTVRLWEKRLETGRERNDRAPEADSVLGVGSDTAALPSPAASSKNRESLMARLVRAARKPLSAKGSRRPRWRTAEIQGRFLVRDCEWRDGYGWRPIQRAEDMDFLDAHRGMAIRFRLLRDGDLRYVLEMTPEQWREALGDYFDRTAWRSNGYIAPVTKMRKGEYTEQFKERWATYVKRA